MSLSKTYHTFPRYHLRLAMSATVANPLAGPSALKDIVRPSFHQNNFAEESWVKNELGIKLDKGKQL